MEDQPKLFTREELKSRCARNDCLLIIHNGVYDVTKFLIEVRAITGSKEVSLQKTKRRFGFGYIYVTSLMKKYKIGELVEADRIPSKNAFSPQWSNDQPQEQGNVWTSWLTPLLLGIAATILYRYLFA
ncbi:hypothetical protein K1T71_002921 [Dendrolimus kikuchii]|uniref:Uncharacterized protein n=1 Tax=Dendrolimus kikuchii TaxID=765133 RepID=A0ACC1DAA8_9NEOP|nr:hypothetical protein K1T71_002921 [Dendrolimus kikuchii]